MKRLFIIFFVLVLCGVGTFSVVMNMREKTARQERELTAERQGLEKIVITNAKDAYTFFVSVARTLKKRSEGLAFRESMAKDEGMIFDFGKEEEVIMWMKDTNIPLDMFFLRSDGVIHSVARNTKPHSLEKIYSGGAVRSVLELNAGVSERLSLKEGDRVQHPIFSSPPQP